MRGTLCAVLVGASFFGAMLLSSPAPKVQTWTGALDAGAAPRALGLDGVAALPPSIAVPNGQLQVAAKAAKRRPAKKVTQLRLTPVSPAAVIAPRAIQRPARTPSRPAAPRPQPTRTIVRQPVRTPVRAPAPRPVPRPRPRPAPTPQSFDGSGASGSGSFDTSSG